MMVITSSQNSVVKGIKALKNRKDREEQGLFFIEGRRIVEEALLEKDHVKELVLSEEFASDIRNSEFLAGMEKSGHKLHLVTRKLFSEITDTESPQGILAVIRMKKHILANELIKNGLYIIMESVRDPGNVGTIIRTADAAGFSGVILSKGCVDAYNPKVLRSTMGSVFHIPVYQVPDIIETLRLLKANGIRILVSHLEGISSIYEVDMKFGIAVAIGSEADGVSEEVKTLADVLVKIPMTGRAESLNASVAAGLLIYETVRQKLFDY